MKLWRHRRTSTIKFPQHFQLFIEHFKTFLKQIEQVFYGFLHLTSFSRLIHKLTNQTRCENKVNLMRIEIYLQSLIIVLRSWKCLQRCNMLCKHWNPSNVSLKILGRWFYRFVTAGWPHFWYSKYERQVNSSGFRYMQNLKMFHLQPHSKFHQLRMRLQLD